MEPSQTYCPEEQLDVMVTAGIDKPTETTIENHLYLVFVLERRAREVFALLDKIFLTNLN